MTAEAVFRREYGRCVAALIRFLGDIDAAEEAAEAGHRSGNARLAVRLLDQATASQARRITTAPQPADPATLSTIDAADIPEDIHPPDPPRRRLARPVPVAGRSGNGEATSSQAKAGIASITGLPAGGTGPAPVISERSR